jgi:hypothetical protein
MRTVLRVHTLAVHVKLAVTFVKNIRMMRLSRAAIVSAPDLCGHLSIK